MMVILATMWLVDFRRGAAPALDVPVEASPVLEDRFPQPKVAFAHDVESQPDLVYSVPPGFRPLRLDLYRPRNTGSVTRGLPLVVYVHGGGWQSGHTRHAGAFANWPGVLALLASKGYVVASIEYRLSGEARFPAAIQDVKTSIRWLRSKSTQFGIDPTQRHHLGRLRWRTTGGPRRDFMQGRVSRTGSAIAPRGAVGLCAGAGDLVWRFRLRQCTAFRCRRAAGEFSCKKISWLYAIGLQIDCGACKSGFAPGQERSPRIAHSR